MNDDWRLDCIISWFKVQHIHRVTRVSRAQIHTHTSPSDAIKNRSYYALLTAWPHYSWLLSRVSAPTLDHIFTSRRRYRRRRHRTHTQFHIQTNDWFIVRSQAIAFRSVVFAVQVRNGRSSQNVNRSINLTFSFNLLRLALMRRCGIESNVSSANGNRGAATAANYLLLFTIKEIEKDFSFGFCQIKNIKNSNLIRLSEYTWREG